MKALVAGAVRHRWVHPVARAHGFPDRSVGRGAGAVDMFAVPTRRAVVDN